MGLFDLLGSIATDISANIEYNFSGGVSDDTMGYTYLAMSMDNEDKKTLSILKDTFGYGDDAYVCLAHMDNVTAMTMAKVAPEVIAQIQGISQDMVLRILQMGVEYSEYRNNGKLPSITEHIPIGGVPSKAVAMARYCKETYNKDAVNNAIKSALNETSSHQSAETITITPTADSNNVSFTNIARGVVNSSADTLASTMSAAEK